MSTTSDYREVAPPTAPPPPAQPPQRKGPSYRLLTAVAVVVLVLFGLNQLEGLLPSLHNPFRTHTVDASSPVLLKSLTNLHTYDAAQGTYTDVVDLKKHTDYVPAALKGKHVTFLAVGSATAGVDFSGLTAADVVVDKTHHAVSIRLPAAKLGIATVDVGKSHILSQGSGLFDKLGDLFGSKGSDAQLYQVAQQRISAAAAGDSAILQRAQANTTAMLKTLTTPLGFPNLTVTYGQAG